MAEMQQGEEYEEEELEDDEEFEYDEDSGLEIDTIYGIPKNTVVLGAAIVIVVIIAIVVAVTWRKGSSKTEQVDNWEDNDFLDTTEYDISFDDTEDNDFLDNDFTEPTEEVYVEPVVESITNEQAEELRKLGYTGDEIQLAIAYGLNYQSLVDHAEELRNEEAKEALQRMSDTAGDEFKHILNYTYLGQGEVDNLSGDRSEYVESRTTVKINADYVKCPTNGNQLWLKCHIADNSYIWYQCPPIRWMSLPDSGNIVLNVDFWLMNDTPYVTGISEADSTLNSIDASHSYDEITSAETPIDETESEGDAGASFLTE